MPHETPSTIIDYAFQLIAEASLSLGFVKGTGLGAILLTLIAIAFIRSRPFLRMRLVKLVKAWRGRNAQPPAE